MTDVRDTVRTLEERRYRAMVDADATVLGELLSEQLVYTHSNGASDTKATYLEKVRNGTFVFDSIDHPEETILVADGVAVVIGTMIAQGWWAGEAKTLRNASMAVWAREDGEWRLLAYQPTPLPTAE